MVLPRHRRRCRGPYATSISAYEARLGPYPYGDEKYALVEFARPSFREAETLSQLGAALRGYVAQHAHGTVTTADFQRACEKASGQSLDEFFDRWVRGTARLTRLY